MNRPVSSFDCELTPTPFGVKTSKALASEKPPSFNAGKRLFHQKMWTLLKKTRSYLIYQHTQFPDCTWTVRRKSDAI